MAIQTHVEERVFGGYKATASSPDGGWLGTTGTGWGDTKQAATRAAIADLNSQLREYRAQKRRERREDRRRR